jgi:hypothetical protein
MSDMCVCVGPPSTVVLGSTGVFFGGKPAARMGDMTAHGGTITVGFPTVLIGEMSPGGGVSGGGASGSRGGSGASGSRDGSAGGLATMANAAQQLPVVAKVVVLQVVSMLEAAVSGMPLVHDSATCPICSKNIDH